MRILVGIIWAASVLGQTAQVNPFPKPLVPIPSSGPGSGTVTTGGCGLTGGANAVTLSVNGLCPSTSVGGTADAITAVYSPVRTTLFTGEMLSFTPGAPNATTTPTFSPDGLTAHTIVKAGAAALAAGDIVTNVAAILKYDATGTRWELQNPQTGGGGTGNAAEVKTPATGASMTFSPSSATTGTSVVFVPTAVLGANVTASTCSGFTPGQTAWFKFVQDGTGGRTVAACSGWDAFSVSATANVATTQAFAIDASGNGHTPGSTDTPFLLGQAPLRAAPTASVSCASGNMAFWGDSTSKAPTFCTDANATKYVAPLIKAARTANQFVINIGADGTQGTAAIAGADLPATVVQTNQSNTYSTGTQDFTSATAITMATQAAGNNATNGANTAFVTTAIANAINASAGRDLVTAATAAVLPNSPTYSNGVSGIGATLTSGSNVALVVDGYTCVLGDRILVKNQASALQNGIYYCSQVGTGILPWILTRALDYDVPSDINNTIVPVANHGTVNPLTSWIQTATVATVGTDSITFAAFTPAGANIVTASSPGAGVAHFAGGTQQATSSAVTNADLANSATTVNGQTCTLGSTCTVPGKTSPTAGTSISLTSGIAQMFVCTSNCTITAPAPAAGAQYCVYNDNNVATVITFSAIGSSASYENTARTAYGTAGTGTFVSGGAVKDSVCIVFRDSTHYSTLSSNGTWTAN